jgi:hypothetical protein
MLLKEVDLWIFVERNVTIPIDPMQLAEHNKKMAKEKRIILDFLKDHLIPPIAKKKTSKEMYDALITVYQSVNISCKMPRKKKLTV